MERYAKTTLALLALRSQDMQIISSRKKNTWFKFFQTNTTEKYFCKKLATKTTLSLIYFLIALSIVSNINEQYVVEEAMGRVAALYMISYRIIPSEVQYVEWVIRAIKERFLQYWIARFRQMKDKCL